MQRCYFLMGKITANNLQINDNLLVRVEDNQGVFMTVGRAAQPDARWPYLVEPLELEKIAGSIELSQDWRLDLTIMTHEECDNTYRKNKNCFTAYLDADKVAEKLQIRTWQTGDSFQPLGMKGQSTKLSDFWVDRKVPRRKKQKRPMRGKMVRTGPAGRHRTGRTARTGCTTWNQSRL